MAAVKETKATVKKDKAPVKANGKAAEPAKEEKPAKVAQEKKAPQENVWNLARTMLQQGKKDEDIQKAALAFLLANTDKEKAFKLWCGRLAARSIWRAHKAAKKEAKNAA